jgi:phosphoglycerate kinase
MHKLTIEDVSFKGKTVFVRVDFNVPLDDDGTIVSDTRIRAALPTINHLIDEGARIIIASHVGRPKGIVNHKYSLKPVHKRLERLLGKQGEIAFAPDCIGPQVRELAEKLGPGQILLLENLRFHKVRPPTTRRSPRRSSRGATPSSTARSAPPTAPTPPRPASQPTCRSRWPASA